MTSPHTPSHLRLLWLCGAPGAGKSVTAWALFQALGDEGVQVAHVDIDQLGMLYPQTEADPDRYSLKMKSLARLMPNYASAGVQILVVSGVVDPASPADLAALLGARSTFCLLNVDDASLRQRILDRGWDAEEADEAVDEARALREAPFIDEVIETTGCSLSNVVERVRPMVDVTHAPAAARPDDAVSVLPSTSVDLTVVCGARAVGSSTVGFGLARTRWEGGRPTAFVDLQQLSFLRRPDHPGQSNTALGIANVIAMHRHCAMRGAEHVIVSAHLKCPAEHHALRQGAPNSRVRIVGLRADASTIAAHLRERAAGNGARLAGDDLPGASAAYQSEVLQAALAEQHALDAHMAEDIRLNVSARTIDDVVSEVEEYLNRTATAWSSGPIALPWQCGG